MTYRRPDPGRNAEIIRRRKDGAYPEQIAKAMGLSHGVVRSVCFRNGLSARSLGGVNGLQNAALDEAKVRVIRDRYRPRDPIDGGAALAREFGISTVAVHMIVTRQSWRHVK